MRTTTELPGEDLLHFDDDSMMEIPAINENFDEKVHQAQEQLLKLRHEQEQLEKQKKELEQLSRQQEKFVNGRTQLVEQLNRSIVILEREAFEAEKRVELFLHTKDSFTRHLEIIESFKPERWSREELRGELTRALIAIEEAETDYNSATCRMTGMLGPKSAAAGAASAGGMGLAGMAGFQSAFLSGLAFTLPLMIFTLVALVLYMLLSF